MFGQLIQRDNMAVHPHMCGVDVSAMDMIIVLGGSSPHVWGRLLEKASRLVKGRFIPTCVG